MSSIIYRHQVPPGIESRLIQRIMGFIGVKGVMNKKIVNDSFNKKPAGIPKSIIRKFDVNTDEFSDRKVWSITPKKNANDNVILFLHGGAYYANITRLHWRLVEKLVDRTNATVVVPDFPLAPAFSCIDTYQFLDTVYLHLTSKYPSSQIVFIGDSSGAGLALGFAQKIRNDGNKQPSAIFLYSPWLDVTMANPEIAVFDKHDKILNVYGLRLAGKNYAGDLDLTDYRVSPIYGDFSNLGKIFIFIGTNEVFIADARKLKQLLADRNIDFGYFEYPGMFHDWVIVPGLKEANDVIDKTVVPGAGLEPARPQWPQDFKSWVSTNSTIRALNNERLSI